jgi:HEAT repeat protein
MKSALCRISPLFVLLLSVSFGCSVDAEKIKKWKKSRSGAAKLRVAVRDKDLDMKLRKLAAIALADINFVDYLSKDLQAVDTKARDQLTRALIDNLKKRMKGTSEQRTTKQQLQAKDALFGLRAGFSDKQRAEVDQAILAWLTQDWFARSAGEHSTAKIISKFGKGAVPGLVAAVGRDPRAVVAIAKLIKKHGSEADRQKATKALVTIMAQPEAKPTQGMFEALGYLGVQAGHTYLLKASSSAGLKFDYRLWALYAVKLIPRAEAAKPLASMMADTKLKPRLRKAAVEALEKIPGKESQQALGEIIAKNPDETMRYRAVEAIISCCKVEGVRQLLRSLPANLKYRHEDVRDLVEADVKKLGKAALPVLREALSSKSWIARVVAVRLVGQLGSKQDVSALQKLTKDRTKLNGWSSKGTPATVGLEAQAAIKKLSK